MKNIETKEGSGISTFLEYYGNQPKSQKYRYIPPALNDLDFVNYLQWIEEEGLVESAKMIYTSKNKSPIGGILLTHPSLIEGYLELELFPFKAQKKLKEIPKHYLDKITTHSKNLEKSGIWKNSFGEVSTNNPFDIGTLEILVLEALKSTPYPIRYLSSNNSYEEHLTEVILQELGFEIIKEETDRENDVAYLTLQHPNTKTSKKRNTIQ